MSVVALFVVSHQPGPIPYGGVESRQIEVVSPGCAQVPRVGLAEASGEESWISQFIRPDLTTFVVSPRVLNVMSVPLFDMYTLFRKAHTSVP